METLVTERPANPPVVALPTEQDPRWAAVVARDHRVDGTFYYSVETTGVYCRPSCASRLANPRNVRFHPTCAEAERAGFRPCKRCKPGQLSLEGQQAAKVAAATGLTPKDYAVVHRAKRVRDELNRSETVTAAIYGAGFNSSSRFYEASDAMLGITPRAWRAGGADAEIRCAVGECSLGSILVATSAKGVCAILLGDDPEALLRELPDRFARAELVGGDPGFELLVAQVVGFVEAPGLGLDLPLDVRGTAFQQRVWWALREIPAGSTASYSEIAERIGAPKAVRAVAAACAANALAVAIPCHRVVRTDGALSGYRWGVERKRALLACEGRAA